MKYAPTVQYVTDYAGQFVPCDCGEMIAVPSLHQAPAEVIARAPLVAAWQDAGHVVAEKGFRLPRRCLKCNARVDTSMKSVTLRWRPTTKGDVATQLGGLLHGGAGAAFFFKK